MAEPTWALFAHDGFSGPDLGLVDGRATDDASGHHWRVPVGAAVVQGGRFRILSPVPMRTVALINMGLFVARTDGKIEVDIPIGSSRIGVVGRMNETASTYYIAYYDGTFVYLFKVIDGTSEYLDRVSLAFQAPSQAFSFEAWGNHLQVRSAVGGLILEVIDNDIPDTGYWGLEVTTPGQFVDAVSFFLDEAAPSTAAPTTGLPTTAPPTTAAPTTAEPTTVAPTTTPEPTFPPSTAAPTTLAPTTATPTTVAPTTLAPTTIAPTTETPIIAGSQIVAEFAYVSERDRLVCRAWVVDDAGRTREIEPDIASCELAIIDELGVTRTVVGADDPETGVVRFVVPQARFYSEHLYLMRIMLDDVGPALFALPVN